MIISFSRTIIFPIVVHVLLLSTNRMMQGSPQLNGIQHIHISLPGCLYHNHFFPYCNFNPTPNYTSHVSTCIRQILSIITNPYHAITETIILQIVTLITILTILLTITLTSSIHPSSRYYQRKLRRNPSYMGYKKRETTT